MAWSLIRYVIKRLLPITGDFFVGAVRAMHRLCMHLQQSPSWILSLSPRTAD